MENFTQFENTVPPRGTEADWGLPGWCSFVLGGMFTFLLVYIGIARPAAYEVSLLKRQMSTLEQSVWEVAGQSETAKKANRLLNLLVEQQDIARKAAVTLERIQRVNRQLAAESKRAEDALSTVRELVALKNSILDGADQTDKAAEVVAATVSLHDQLAAASNSTSAAVHSGAQLLAIGNELSSFGHDVASAQDTVDQIRQLHTSLNEHSSQVAAAQVCIDRLLTMKDTIVEQTTNLTDVATAQLRVDSLLSMKDTIISQTANLADAIETLELANDLSNQFQNASSTFEHMRRWMVEVVTMESMLKRAQNALEPLTELGNLRRLDANQLRSIARTISRGYLTQVAQKPDSTHEFGNAGAQTAALDSGDLTLTDSVDIE